MRLIDADAVEKRVRKLKAQIATRAAGFVDEDSYECGAVDALHDALTYLDEAPTVDAVPVKHGRWIKRGYACGESEYKCSACGETEWRTNCGRMKYCMFCGAKMDGGGADG